MRIGEVLTMDEYIRREDVIEWFMPYAHAGESIDADVVISDIKGMKAADVAPVVRCKDCKYYKESRVLAPNKFCFRLNHPTEPRKIGYNFGDDDFCSYGERRDKP